MNNFLTDELIQKIRDVSGLRLNEIDRQKLTEWVRARLATLGLTSPLDYLKYLQDSQDLSLDRQMLSELLTTGETFFMRDPGQMALISRVIFPELIKKNQQKKTLRIWAPACSTGEEVYSLIILLDKFLIEQKDWKIDVIGSDINSDFIERAKKAIYGNWAFRGCDANFKINYFEKYGDKWILNEHIRNRARFLTLDLTNASLPDYSNNLYEIDLIVCRNLFIYMNFGAIKLITDKLAECLAPEGILMTAHGELHAYRHSSLGVKIYPESLIYKKESGLVFHDSAELLNTHSLGNQSFDSHGLHRETQKANRLIPDKSISLMMEQAWYLADRAKFIDALNIYKEISSRNPMLAELHYLHAVISTETGDFEQAKTDLRKALYLEVNFIPAYLELITIYMHENKLMMASKFCEQALNAIETMQTDQIIPCLKNNSVTDVKLYLINIKNNIKKMFDSP